MIEKRVLKGGAVRWKARVKSGGEVVAQQTFRLKGDAERWEREQQRALQLGSLMQTRQVKTTLAEVMAQFVVARVDQVAPHSQRTDRDNLAALPVGLTRRPIGSVPEADMLSFLTDQLRVKERSTVARMRTSLSALFTYALRERYITTHPVRGVKLPPGSRQRPVDEWFTEEALASTLCAQHELSPHYAAITEWASLTGLRWSELRALRVSDLQDVPFPAVWVRRAHSEGYEEKAPKTSNGVRSVPLTNRAREIAREAAAGKSPEKYHFSSATGRQLRITLYRRCTGWSTTAPGKRPHMLRHYCASRWLRAGIPVNQVAEWLGDDPRTVLKVYAHVLGERQTIDALNRLNGLDSGPSRDPRTESDSHAVPIRSTDTQTRTGN